VGSASALYYYKHRALYNSTPASPLTELPHPTEKTRLLVFAPHCDDDILGCAGLIQQTVKSGGKVQVVMLTNGDGFRTAVQRQERKFRVEPKDFVRFAERRQREAMQGLQGLGVAERDMLFLGYPDRGLMPIWNGYWSSTQPYTSRYTRCTACPYPNSLNRRAVYSGESVLGEIEQVMEQFQPTLVAITHPADDHGDHAAGSAFVTLALKQLQQKATTQNWAQATQIEYYLIHRGDWPPKDDKALAPPPEMAHLDTVWNTLPLVEQEQKQKQISLSAHTSQLALSRSFLVTFLRQNELFGELQTETIARVEQNRMKLEGSGKDWEGIPSTFRYPVNDSFVRSAQAGGDVEALGVCHDEKNLYVRVVFNAKIGRQYRYILNLRAFTTEGETPPQALTLALHDVGGLKRKGILRAVRGNALEIAVPKNLFEAKTGRQPALLALSVESYVASLEVDKTGIRLLKY
jgi:LmbE family N-acetylglucosaminyl deacetylase